MKPLLLSVELEKWISAGRSMQSLGPSSQYHSNHCDRSSESEAETFPICTRASNAAKNATATRRIGTTTLGVSCHGCLKHVAKYGYVHPPDILSGLSYKIEVSWQHRADTSLLNAVFHCRRGSQTRAVAL